MAVEFDDLLIDWIGITKPSDNPSKNVRNILLAIRRAVSKEAIDFMDTHPEFSWEAKLGAIMGATSILAEFAISYLDNENLTACQPTESA